MLIEIYLLAIGLMVGSFLNVCISRLPEGESVVRPRSRCPKCKYEIAWFDNIPVLSFVILLGKCRHCRARISLRYPTVEIVSGLLWYSAWKWSGGVAPFFVNVIFLSLLLVVSVTDLETGLIPDKVTFPGIGLGLAASFFYPALQWNTSVGSAVLASALGLGLGGLLIYLTGLIGDWIFQRESMGGGDVKLLAMIGCFLGWEKVLLTYFTAPFFAFPFALYTRLAKKEETIPYGPFLALAGLIQFFYGDIFWNYFLRL